MTITLRMIGNGRPAACGDTVTRQDDGAAFVVDNWSEGACKVYAHRANRAFRGSDEFNPSELGLYIGHERGQPISAIQWPKHTPRDRAAERGVFMEALGDYVDARINYNAAEPEWRSTRDMAAATDRLEQALEALL